MTEGVRVAAGDRRGHARYNGDKRNSGTDQRSSDPLADWSRQPLQGAIVGTEMPGVSIVERAEGRGRRAAHPRAGGHQGGVDRAKGQRWRT